MPTKALYLNAIEIQSAKNAQLDQNTSSNERTYFPYTGTPLICFKTVQVTFYMA